MAERKMSRHGVKSLNIKIQSPKSTKEKRLSFYDVRTPKTSTLDELAQCGICLDMMTNPKMLPCQHTFCLQCLKDAATQKCISTTPLTTVKTACHQLSCPLCKIPVPLDGLESLDALPNNIYIETLLTFINNSGDTSPTKVPGKFTRHCTSCQTILQLEDQSCPHCKQPFCKTCWPEHASKLVAKLPSLIRQLEESEGRLQHRMEIFENRNQSLTATIHSATEAKLLEIKTKEESVLEELAKVIEEELQNSSLLKSKISNAKEDISQLDFGAIRSDVEKINIYMEFHKNTGKLLDQVSHIGEIRAIFDSDSFKLDKSTEYAAQDEEDHAPTAVDSTTNPLENEESLLNFYKNHSFSPKLVWNKCPRPTGVGIPPWASHHLYIAANDTKIVLVLDRNTNKVIGRLTNEDMLCAHSLVFSQTRKETYVTDKWGHCIHIFAHTGEYLRTICSRGASEGKLISPEGLAIGPKDELFVCDTGNNRVVVLDPESGQQLNIIGRIKRKTEFDTPTSVAYFNEKIYVADSGSNRIKVFALSGEKAFEFGSMGKNRGQFRSPETVTVDPMGYILVGDCGNARIQVFTPSGEFVRSLGRPGEGPGKFRWVSGLVVSPQMEIVTADHKNKSVQIF